MPVAFRLDIPARQDFEKLAAATEGTRTASGEVVGGAERAPATCRAGVVGLAWSGWLDPSALKVAWRVSLWLNRCRRAASDVMIFRVSDSEAMAGGVNAVLRIGDRVHRPAGEWTPAVHAVLGHLAVNGFGGAPRAHGFDVEGREVVDFVAGEVPDSEAVVSDEALAEMAVLLRGLHDATVGFVPPVGAKWYFEPREPVEVVCHGDVAPYNTVFRGGRPVALIDFDTAHPGPRVWDVAYAAYRFVQLVENGAGFEEQARRLAVFADAYGLAEKDRAVLIDTVIARLEHLVGFMRAQAAAGHPAFSRHVAEGHDRYYLRNIAHVEGARPVFEAALVPVSELIAEPAEDVSAPSRAVRVR